MVADEGIGIPADETERVFERFYRVDKARARATGGTGLGLSIVRHVVVNHGGEVILQSSEGLGTTFTLRFPLPTEVDSRGALQRDRSELGTSMREAAMPEAPTPDSDMQSPSTARVRQ